MQHWLMIADLIGDGSALANAVVVVIITITRQPNRQEPNDPDR